MTPVFLSFFVFFGLFYYFSPTWGRVGREFWAIIFPLDLLSFEDRLARITHCVAFTFSSIYGIFSLTFSKSLFLALFPWPVHPKDFFPPLSVIFPYVPVPVYGLSVFFSSF